MYTIKVILRVLFYAIISFLGVVAVHTGCTKAKSETKMFPSVLDVPGGVMLLAALGCCIAGLRIDAVFAALGCVCFFALGTFNDKSDIDLYRQGCIIRLIIYLVIVVVFALL